MAYALDGLKRTIALALGLAPLGMGGCLSPIIDDTASSDGSSGDGSSSGGSSSGSDTGHTTDPTSATVGSTGAPPLPVCTPTDNYLEVSFCYGGPNSNGACECVDDGCRAAAEEAWYADGNGGSCWYVFSEATCSEMIGEQCCFLGLMYEEGCGKGRPLFVDGSARTASAQPRTDWSIPVSPTAANPDAAAHWLRAALDEHASVASFARFALDLSAVGAPPDLLADAAAAMRDEVRHAQLSFSLARRFGAAAQGPGPLDVGTHDGRSLEDIVLATVVEGCIGETLAAAEAELAAQRARDPDVAAALREIADDEARHAALAWRFVQWALAEHPQLSTVVRQAFADAAAMDTRSSDPAPEGLEALGVLSPQTVAAVRAQTLQETVLPCGQALVATAASTPEPHCRPGLPQ
jgi:hypothetical protein